MNMQSKITLILNAMMNIIKKEEQELEEALNNEDSLENALMYLKSNVKSSMCWFLNQHDELTGRSGSFDWSEWSFKQLLKRAFNAFEDDQWMAYINTLSRPSDLECYFEQLEKRPIYRDF